MRTLRIPAAAVCAALVLLAAACGGESGGAPAPATATARAGETAVPPPSVTASVAAAPATQATATAAPARDNCPYEGQACDLALKLADTLGKRDFAAAAKLFSGANLVCPDPPSGPAQGIPAVEDAVCKGKKKGDRVRAVLTGLLQSDAVGASLLDEVPAALSRLFQGQSIPPLYSIGYEGKAACLDCLSIVFALESDRAVVLKVVREGGAWGATAIYRGGFSSIETTTIGGRVYHRYDAAAKTWSAELTAKEAGPEYDAVVSAGGDCLNLRDGPGANTKVLRCLPDGTAVLVSEPRRPIIEGTTTWVTVVLYENGQQVSGWASKEFLKRR